MSKDDPDRFDRAIMAWHASPHDFDEFGPMRKVSGTGQGAASYGRGAAYVAENPKVSGPGESEYMKEFSHHPAVKGKRATWQTDDGFGNNNWIDLDEADTPFEETHPPALFDPKMSAETWAAGWLQYHLANRPDDPRAIDRVREQLRHDVDHYHKRPKDAGNYPNLTAFLNQNSFVPEEDIGFDKRHAEAIHKWFEKYGQALDAGLLFRHQPEQAKPQAGPFSYKVAVHLRPETTLDWDAGFEDHHPEAQEKMARAMAGKDIDILGPENDKARQAYLQSVKQSMTGMSGKLIYPTLVNQHKGDYEASEALFNAGIHGIRYKDQGSRNVKPALYFDGKPVEQAITDLEKAARDEDLPLYDHLINTRDAYDHMHHSRPSINLLRSSIGNNETAGWIEDNHHRFELVHPKPTYNYVVFHPDFVEAMAQYNIKGEKIRDIGPGVHLKAVDHDPFKGEVK